MYENMANSVHGYGMWDNVLGCLAPFWLNVTTQGWLQCASRKNYDTVILFIVCYVVCKTEQ